MLEQVPKFKASVHVRKTPWT